MKSEVISCCLCKKLILPPKGIKYITKGGSYEYYCKRRCFVFKKNKVVSPRKLLHLNKLRQIENSNKK